MTDQPLGRESNETCAEVKLLNASEAKQKCSRGLGFPHLSFSSRLPPVWSLQCNTTSSCH